VVSKTGERGKISVRTVVDGDDVVISLADTGGGIPENVQSRVFEPFFTTKAVGRGTGQGLSIAHNVIVKGHGGKIHFETVMDRGTTFYVRLPMRRSDVDSIP
jgi:signal transduction histidine kinase